MNHSTLDDITKFACVCFLSLLIPYSKLLPDLPTKVQKQTEGDAKAVEPAAAPVITSDGAAPTTTVADERTPADAKPQDKEPPAPAPAPAPAKGTPETSNGNGAFEIDKTASVPGSSPTESAKSALPPGIPAGVPTGVPMAMPTAQSQSQPMPQAAATATATATPTTAATLPQASSTPGATAPPTTSSSSSSGGGTIVEKCDLPSLYVGRIIGKGGEQIRDLQARSACKIDVDQNVPHGAPRIITYQGPRDKIEFAKSLVQKLCSDNWKNVDLPLGFATRIKISVPGNVIGKIIGRGGEMIKVRLVLIRVDWIGFSLELDFAGSTVFF